MMVLSTVAMHRVRADSAEPTALTVAADGSMAALPSAGDAVAVDGVVTQLETTANAEAAPAWLTAFARNLTASVGDLSVRVKNLEASYRQLHNEMGDIAAALFTPAKAERIEQCHSVLETRRCGCSVQSLVSLVSLWACAQAR